MAHITRKFASTSLITCNSFSIILTLLFCVTGICPIFLPLFLQLLCRTKCSSEHILNLSHCSHADEGPHPSSRSSRGICFPCFWAHLPLTIKYFYRLWTHKPLPGTWYIFFKSESIKLCFTHLISLPFLLISQSFYFLLFLPC